MFAPSRILVPTDFSEFSDHALADAIDIAARYGSTIYLLHVVGVVQQCSVDYCMSNEAVDGVRNSVVQSAARMMEKQVERVVKNREITIEKDIVEARPVYTKILEVQKERGIDLIVIASHGKSGLLHRLLGSVADKVTRMATCPVYLLRPSG